MTTIPTPRTDIVAEAVSTPKNQFRNAAAMLTTVASFATQCQKLEDAIHSARLGFTVDNAFGAGLNIVGKWADVDRSGLLDDDYRAVIKATIKARRSSGTLDDIAAVAYLADARAYRVYHGGVYGTLVEACGVWGSLNPSILLGLLNKTREAGGEMALVYHYDNDDAVMRFASGDEIETDVDYGFGSGVFAEYLR